MCAEEPHLCTGRRVSLSAVWLDAGCLTPDDNPLSLDLAHRRMAIYVLGKQIFTGLCTVCKIKTPTLTSSSLCFGGRPSCAGSSSTKDDTHPEVEHRVCLRRIIIKNIPLPGMGNEPTTSIYCCGAGWRLKEKQSQTHIRRHTNKQLCCRMGEKTGKKKQKSSQASRLCSLFEGLFVCFFSSTKGFRFRFAAVCAVCSI